MLLFNASQVLAKITTLAVAKQKNVFAAMFKREQFEIPAGDIETPRAESTEEKAVFYADTFVASLSAVRRAAMLRGVFPPELYKIGETFDETILKFQLSAPDPTISSLVERIRSFDNVMTFLKTEDLLLELPSKRLLCKYVTSSFWKTDQELYQDFEKHFRIIRNSKTIVDTVRDVAASDLEFGVLSRTYLQMTAIPDYLLTIFVKNKVANGLTEAGERLDKMSRSAELKGLPADQKQLAALEKDSTDLKKRQTLVEQQGVTIEKLYKKLATSQLMLDEAERKRAGMMRLGQKIRGEGIESNIKSGDRLDWMDRFTKAQSAPEGTSSELESKYYELSSLAHDFLATASKSAVIIIDELSFPVHAKSIKPVMTTQVDGRAEEAGRGDSGLRYKYVMYKAVERSRHCLHYANYVMHCCCFRLQRRLQNAPSTFTNTIIFICCQVRD